MNDLAKIHEHPQLKYVFCLMSFLGLVIVVFSNVIKLKDLSVYRALPSNNTFKYITVNEDIFNIKFKVEDKSSVMKGDIIYYYSLKDDDEIHPYFSPAEGQIQIFHKESYSKGEIVAKIDTKAPYYYHYIDFYSANAPITDDLNRLSIHYKDMLIFDEGDNLISITEARYVEANGSVRTKLTFKSLPDSYDEYIGAVTVIEDKGSISFIKWLRRLITDAS